MNEPSSESHIANYREVELPPLAHSPLWDTYLAQRERIRELESDLAATRAENERLIAAQSKADESEPEESPVCPQCGYSWERDGFSHARDCPRQRALGLKRDIENE